MRWRKAFLREETAEDMVAVRRRKMTEITILGRYEKDKNVFCPAAGIS
jgi:hypothetical protein